MTSVFAITPFQPATADQIRQCERAIGARFPSEYREFLETNNGGHPTSSVLEFRSTGGAEIETTIRFLLGVLDSTEAEKDLLSTFRFYVEARRIAPLILPVALDIADNLVCIDLRAGRIGDILYWDHELEFSPMPYTRIADSFSGFLAMLKEE